MHKWDRHLQERQPGFAPVAWSAALDWREQEELRSRRWRRSSQGWYVPAHIDLTIVQRIAEAHALIPIAAPWAGGPQRICTARLSSTAAGVGESELPVLLCVRPQDTVRRRPGVELLRGSLPESDITIVHGIRCTTPVRTAFDLARRANHPFAAVAAIETLVEMSTHHRGRSARYARSHPRWRGVGRARDAVGLATDGVRSPPETWMRLTWEVSAGLPGLLVNRPVFSLTGQLLRHRRRARGRVGIGPRVRRRWAPCSGPCRRGHLSRRTIQRTRASHASRHEGRSHRCHARSADRAHARLARDRPRPRHRRRSLDDGATGRVADARMGPDTPRLNSQTVPYLGKHPACDKRWAGLGEGVHSRG